jgi:hydrogenase maturation protein HypF
MVLHDREIMMPCEDTVMRVHGDDLVTTRRSWGQAPLPLVLDHEIPSILALGGIHRGTLALGFDRWIVLSQHLGELDSPAVEILYRQTLAHLSRLHDFKASALAYDLHPKSLGRRLCKETELPSIGVQHHHAHIAGVMAEHNLKGPVLGLALDQSGWGEDETLWGSEFLLGDAREVQRIDHLPYFPLPGGTTAFAHPWRSAAGLLWELKGEDAAKTWLESSAPDPVAAETTLSLLREDLNCPRACGLGAVYDALAAILGLSNNQSFDGQAPMSLERLAGVPHEIDASKLPDPHADATETLRAIVDHLLLRPFNSRQLVRAGAWTQAAVARFIAQRTVSLAREHQIDTVVASGGCLVNGWLRQELRTRLARAKLRFFTNAAIPPSDGGLPVGQIHVAAARLSRV